MNQQEKIEANLNFGMSTAKQYHSTIQPQVLPNLLEHSQKRETEGNHATVVIGTLLGSLDGKMVNISNSFPMSLKIEKKGNQDEGKANSQPEYVFDTEYLKKMVKFHKSINEHENVIGVYISSTEVDRLTMITVQYFSALFKEKIVKSPLASPLILMYDPLLQKNRLDIKVMTVHSTFFAECPFLSEIPFKFNLSNFDKTGLDVLFFGQDHFDTMAILDSRQNITQDNFSDLLKNQRVLADRDLMLKNFRLLIQNLTDCEEYLQKVITGEQPKNPEVARSLNQCLSQFTRQDLAILEEMVYTNFKDAAMMNNLGKLQMAQVSLTERLNNLFSASVNQYLSHQTKKFTPSKDAAPQKGKKK